MADGELLEELTEEDSTYDAYEKDIAVLNLFYGDPEFAGNSWFWYFSFHTALCFWACTELPRNTILI